MIFPLTISNQRQRGIGMIKLSVAMFTLALLCGCTSSQSELLGEPRTTTENVIMESRGASAPEFKDVVAAWNNSTSEADRAELHTMDYTIRKGVAELSPRVLFMKNERRTLFFYPRKTSLGSVEPGYAIEYATYKELHTLMSK